MSDSWQLQVSSYLTFLFLRNFHLTNFTSYFSPFFYESSPIDPPISPVELRDIGVGKLTSAASKFALVLIDLFFNSSLKKGLKVYFDFSLLTDPLTYSNFDNDDNDDDNEMKVLKCRLSATV